MFNVQNLFHMMSNLSVSDDIVDAEVIASMSSMSLEDSEKCSGEMATEVAEQPKVKEGSNLEFKSKKKWTVEDYLCHIQKRYECASEIDLKLPVYPLCESDDVCLKRFQHIAEIIHHQIYQGVSFITSLPAYRSLLHKHIEELLIYITGSIMDLFVLEAARKYDMTTDSIVLIKDRSYTYVDFERAELGDFAKGIFAFCRNMNQLQLNDTEYALLKVIVLFTEHPNCLLPQPLESYKAFFTKKLRKSICGKHPFSQNFFDWLRLTVNELHLIAMKEKALLQNHPKAANYSPLVKEIFNIRP